MSGRAFIRKSLMIAFLLSCMLIFSGCSVFTLPKPLIPESSKIYDSTGKVLTTLYKQNRIQVPLKQIPELTQNAFIAVEDARFYKHFGLDPIRIVGAIWRDILAGKIVQGGSTITQQTAKNLFLTRQKTFGRKFIEAWLAIQLEIKYSKKQILEMYLNQIYFGQGAYGIEVASDTYFNKPAAKLDLAESAMLAGLPKAPNTYSPFQNWKAAKSRQKVVLNRMVEAGFINRDQADKAYKEKLVLKSGTTKNSGASYIVSEVIKYITNKYEDGAKMLFTEGLSVYTTIDQDMQKAAEEAFNDGLAQHKAGLDGALVSIDPSNGSIKAMVGGRDFSKSKFNRATQAQRQPGSAFKPFLYSAAIDLGYTEGTTETCEQVSFPQLSGKTYQPTDYGQVPYHNKTFILKKALAISDNIVAVKLANEINPQTLVAYAHKMGIKSQLRPYLSLALGTSEVTPLELTGAYGTLASGGIKTEPRLIEKIKDKSGNILEQNRSTSQRVLPAATAYIVSDMLSAVLQPGGTAHSLASIINRPAAGKTGTTQNFQDAWFVGYTPELVTGVYIGYDDPKRSVGIPGGQIAGPIWANFMAQALSKKVPSDFILPPGITKVQICTDSGLLAPPGALETMEASFIVGTEPTNYCNLHSGFNNPGSTDTPNNDLTYENPETQKLRDKILNWFKTRP